MNKTELVAAIATLLKEEIKEKLAKAEAKNKAKTA